MTRDIHLIIPGAQKAGTTWLQHIFDRHEECWCPPNPQEIHFFDQKYDQGFQYYRSLYEPASRSEITVDVTPNYLSCEPAPGRIRAFAEQQDREIRFLIPLREPVDRLRSAFIMKTRQGQEVELPTQLDPGSDLVDKSLYATHLQRFHEDFSTEQMLTVVFEELIDDKESVFRQIESFLQLSTGLEDPYENRVVNTGGLRKYSFLDRLFMAGGRILRSLDATHLIHAIKSSKFVSLIKRANKTTFSFSDRQKQMLKELRNEFAEDVYHLAKLIDRPDLPSIWGYDDIPANSAVERPSQKQPDA